MADTEKKTAIVDLHLLEPRATEKTYAESLKRTYVFPVKKNMSKQEVAKLVEKEFNVTVVDVRTLIRNGKKTKYSKGKHAYPGTTYRQDKKYAYVTLKEGDSIKVFEEQNDNTSAKDAKKAAKEAKKADKNAGKEKK
ncbi:MAG: 50S ribosomal protein L23 [Candidatus Saccharibacteria bacterium]|nr:50S ribosomal protein L23 [Candidatus Saccharibacteria bacterium]